MKCEYCGFENKKGAKFCSKCGATLEDDSNGGNNTKYIIIALIAVIIVLVGCIGYFAGTMNSSGVQSNDAPVKNTSSQPISSAEESSDNDAQTQTVSTSQSTSSNAKSWKLIGSYSGSGSGSQTVKVPAGDIMVKLSAYPIKNYATNHLYVSGSNGQSGGVDWGSHSDVETRSDSFTYTSSSSETFTIDYYETVSWEVEFYSYQ